jgi:hypothetical protein
MNRFWPLVPILLLAAGGSLRALAESETHSDSAGTNSSDSLTVSTAAIVDQPIDRTKLYLVGGTMIAGMTTIHIYQQNGWWKDNRSPFHFQEDLTYGLWVDKIGHFYGAALFTFTSSRLLEWANVPANHAVLYGAGMALLFQTYIEIEDGFSTWGFDRVDFAFDIGGAAWPVLQDRVSFLKNFDLKLSYRPSPLLDQPGGSGFRGQKHLMIDDYEGQTFFLSANVNNLLPVAAKPYWPEFLCLAVGFGARDIVKPEPYPVLFLSLDYDMRRIIPQTSSFLRTLSAALNFVHFPAPTVRISPSVIWYGLYY